jgi:hypothetical protein
MEEVEGLVGSSFLWILKTLWCPIVRRFRRSLKQSRPECELSRSAKENESLRRTYSLIIRYNYSLITAWCLWIPSSLLMCLKFLCACHPLICVATFFSVWWNVCFRLIPSFILPAVSNILLFCLPSCSVPSLPLEPRTTAAAAAIVVIIIIMTLFLICIVHHVSWKEPGSSVGIVSDYILDGRVSILDRGRGFFSSSLCASRPTLGPIPPLYSGYRGLIPWG